MYIYYSIGNNSGLQTLVRIVEVSVMERVCFQRFHCIGLVILHVPVHCRMCILWDVHLVVLM